MSLKNVLTKLKLVKVSKETEEDYTAAAAVAKSNFNALDEALDTRTAAEKETTQKKADALIDSLKELAVSTTSTSTVKPVSSKVKTASAKAETAIDDLKKTLK